jgi:hypothetical protein
VFAVSLLVTPAGLRAGAADTPVAPAAARSDSPATGTSSRVVVRIGALLFAVGSVATYVAAGTRRQPVREVDIDGRDL